MRVWAEAHLDPVISSLDWRRVERLIESGAIDLQRLSDHTLHNQMEPIIIGIDAAGPGDDHILDGAHRFVAYALSATKAGFGGVELPLPAYALKPDEWRQFLFPKFIAEAMRFDEHY